MEWRFSVFRIVASTLTGGAAVAVLAVVAVIAAQQATIKYNLEYEEVDHKKTPVPEWLAWETGFRILASTLRQPSKVITGSVGLSDDDLKLVLHEAGEQAIRDRQCEEQAKKVEPLLDVVPTPYGEINAKNQAIQIECRWRTLDARDRLFKTLSPEGMIALSTWIEQQKTGIQSYVPKGGLAHYRLPQ
jgi:hypothetical protein